ncbi:hypothetical protein VTP01DRAFT_2620 [Rhizomucor pusillus]|uniref:uncharacterized protein n=1 Tax=Rhizomucor pusillus TaxID=4840 RepID=UPI0037431048
MDSAAIDPELYALIGGAPPIAFVKPTFTSKHLDTKKRATPWSLQTFTNPARSDELALQHWVRQDQANTDNQGYYFAKFNRVIDVPEYTNEEYDKYLTDPDWSREETDYLFSLCRQFDLRFPVIHDRYSFPDRQRSMEDLKERYYAIQTKLIKVRPHVPGEYPQERQVLLQQYAFDKAKEVERKQALNALFNRSREEIEHERALFIEARKIEQNEMWLSKERENLLSALQLEQAQQAPATPITPTSAGSANAALSTPGGIGITGGTAGSPVDAKKKKAVARDEVASSSNLKKARRVSNASSAGLLDDIIPEKKEKLVQGIQVRSQQLPVITKQALQQKVLKALSDLGIGARPNMPTGQVCSKYEQLHHSIVYLVELRKTVEKMESDHQSKLQRRQGGAGFGGRTTSSSSRDKRRK